MLPRRQTDGDAYTNSHGDDYARAHGVLSTATLTPIVVSLPINALAEHDDMVGLAPFYEKYVRMPSLLPLVASSQAD